MSACASCATEMAAAARSCLACGAQTATRRAELDRATASVPAQD